MELISYLLGTTALVVPVNRDSVLWPGNDHYEELIEPVRSKRCQVYGLVRTFGILPEAQIAYHPEFLEAFSFLPYRIADRRAMLRCRAWVEEFGRRYDRIVYLRREARDPVNQIWTQALRGGPKGRAPDPGLLDRIKIVEAPHGRLTDSLFRAQLQRTCRNAS